jgi:hypothetical protein
MPVRVIEASSRRDIIAYLEKESREASDRPVTPSFAQSAAKQHLSFRLARVATASARSLASAARVEAQAALARCALPARPPWRHTAVDGRSQRP